MPEKNKELINNKDSGRYEFHIDGCTPFVEYRIQGETIHLMHTEVPDELEGQGIGSKLAQAVLEDIQAKGLDVKVGCPFISHYMQKSEER
ncbi:MAG: N-acetyltransferase [Flavobacteriaceae bacterium]|nr:N-acetyltransferase [Flavobacteriaceae bacterium]